MKWAFKAFGAADADQLNDSHGETDESITWEPVDPGEPFRWELRGIITAEEQQAALDTINDQLVDMGLSSELIGIDLHKPCRWCGKDKHDIAHRPVDKPFPKHEYEDALN